MIAGEKVFMFNPFLIKQWSEEQIEKQVNLLLEMSNPNADIPSEIAKEIEVRANILCLLGEMISRLTYSLSIIKLDNDIKEAKALQRARKNWKESTTDKAPAIQYFEAIASEDVRDDREKEMKVKANLTRFKYSYDSMENKMNALKFKLKATQYEIGGN